MNRILKLSPILALMALAACETVQGAGRDMQAAGTAVSRDFVELPSQLYEHWLTIPAVLEKYAVHYRKIPI